MRGASALLALTERASVLVAYDYPPPFPLSEKRDLCAAFATALLLSPEGTAHTRIRLALELISDGIEDRLDPPELEDLRTCNPAARSLPLLQAIAQNGSRHVVLPYSAYQQLLVELDR